MLRRERGHVGEGRGSGLEKKGDIIKIRWLICKFNKITALSLLFSVLLLLLSITISSILSVSFLLIIFFSYIHFSMFPQHRNFSEKAFDSLRRKSRSVRYVLIDLFPTIGDRSIGHFIVIQMFFFFYWLLSNLHRCPHF